MLVQFKMMILSLFMAGNVHATDVNLDTENIKQVTCLSQAVYGEASSQSYSGKLAVAHVILNRTKDEKFPDTPCGVIKQAGQFHFKPKNIQYEKNPAVKVQMEDSIRAALDAMKGESPDVSKGSLYFVNLKTATNNLDWLKNLRKMVRIDDHWFFASPKPKSNRRTVVSYRIAMKSER